MGKCDATIGGKPKTLKGPNKVKHKAANARKEGHPTTPPETQIDNNEFGDNSSLVKDYRLVSTILGIVLAQKREICWALTLARLLQAAYNINLKDIKSYLEFMHEDLLQHLKPKELTSKVASLELKNIKKALVHIKKEGLLTVSSTESNKPGGSGHHEKWDFSVKENATAEFVREKLDVSPVAISFNIGTNNEFQNIAKGIYNVRVLEAEKGKKITSHMVLVVGYGYTKDGKLFFLIQNSWGEKWGVKGYGRISIDENSAATVVYP